MKKSLLLIVLLATVNSGLFAENESSSNRTRPLEFRKSTPSKNRPTDSGSQLIGEIGDGVLSLDGSLYFVVAAALVLWLFSTLQTAVKSTMLLLSEINAVWTGVIITAEVFAVLLYCRFASFEMRNRDNKAIPLYKRIIFGVLSAAFIVALICIDD